MSDLELKKLLKEMVKALDYTLDHMNSTALGSMAKPTCEEVFAILNKGKCFINKKDKK